MVGVVVVVVNAWSEPLSRAVRADIARGRGGRRRGGGRGWTARHSDSQSCRGG